MDGRDLYDNLSVLSNWENEGGARAAAAASPSDDILQSFGQSVATHWNELPHGFKQAVFREIASREGPGLKERAARFLHGTSLQFVKAAPKRAHATPRNDNDPS